MTLHLWRTVTLLVPSPRICMLPLQMTKLARPSVQRNNSSEKFNLELSPQWFALSFVQMWLLVQEEVLHLWLGLGFECGHIRTKDKANH